MKIINVIEPLLCMECAKRNPISSLESATLTTNFDFSPNCPKSSKIGSYNSYHYAKYIKYLESVGAKKPKPEPLLTVICGKIEIAFIEMKSDSIIVNFNIPAVFIIDKERISLNILRDFWTATKFLQATIQHEVIKPEALPNLIRKLSCFKVLLLKLKSTFDGKEDTENCYEIIHTTDSYCNYEGVRNEKNRFENRRGRAWAWYPRTTFSY